MLVSDFSTHRRLDHFLRHPLPPEMTIVCACDQLSRSYTTPSALGFTPLDTLDFSQDSKLFVLLELCDLTLERLSLCFEETR